MTAAQVFAVTILVLVGIIVVLAIAANTKVLQEEKALRRELADLSREADQIGPHPTAAQVAALTARVAAFRQRLDDFRRSPFVIGNCREGLMGK